MFTHTQDFNQGLKGDQNVGTLIKLYFANFLSPVRHYLITYFLQHVALEPPVGDHCAKGSYMQAFLPGFHLPSCVPPVFGPCMCLNEHRQIRSRKQRLCVRAPYTGKSQ